MTAQEKLAEHLKTAEFFNNEPAVFDSAVVAALIREVMAWRACEVADNYSAQLDMELDEARANTDKLLGSE